jgi:hypothetical protein
MATAPRSERMKLKVTVQFEPNRLSDECLSKAYELALPLNSQQTKSKAKQQNSCIGENYELRKAVSNG